MFKAARLCAVFCSCGDTGTLVAQTARQLVSVRGTRRKRWRTAASRATPAACFRGHRATANREDCAPTQRPGQAPPEALRLRARPLAHTWHATSEFLCKQQRRGVGTRSAPRSACAPCAGLRSARKLLLRLGGDARVAGSCMKREKRVLSRWPAPRCWSPQRVLLRALHAHCNAWGGRWRQAVSVVRCTMYGMRGGWGTSSSGSLAQRRRHFGGVCGEVTQLRSCRRLLRMFERVWCDGRAFVACVHFFDFQNT